MLLSPWCLLSKTNAVIVYKVWRLRRRVKLVSTAPLVKLVSTSQNTSCLELFHISASPCELFLPPPPHSSYSPILSLPSVCLVLHERTFEGGGKMACTCAGVVQRRLGRMAQAHLPAAAPTALRCPA